MTKKSATSLAVIVLLNLSPATLLAQAAPPAKVHNKPTAPVARMSSLNEQQKREKIREIRQQSHQQIEALISPQQQEALKACQSERTAARGGSTGHSAGKVHHGGGPCGEMTAPKPPSEPERP